MVFKVETLLRYLNHRFKIHTFKYKNPPLFPTYDFIQSFHPVQNCVSVQFPFLGVFSSFYNRDNLNVYVSSIWQYGLWSFQTGGTKLERFLHKNQHTQRKLLNFENWVNGEVLKIGHRFSKESDLKLDAIKKCQ